MSHLQGKCSYTRAEEEGSGVVENNHSIEIKA